jgi:lipopolysaccharide exporter
MSNNARASTPSLAVRMVKGAGWMVAWRMVTRLLGIVSTIILVRLLVPADFGLFALATSISQSLESLVAVGVIEALIREPEPDREMYDTGFTMNLLRSLFVSLCLAAGASSAAAIFGDPRLTLMLLALAGLSLIGAFENIGIVEFRRHLTFDKEFLLAALPRIAGILTTIAFAVTFRNYWALLAGIAMVRVMRLILTYWLHPYRPGITLRAWRRIIGFSFWTWIGSIGVMIQDRMDPLVIGRALGATQVGMYAVGNEIGNLASTELVEPLAAAMFAGFSAGRREGADIGAGLYKSVSVTLMITLPIGVGISLVAAPLISLLFGTRWLEAVPIVQVFALLGVARALPYFGTVLLMTHGYLNIQFRIIMAGVILRFILLISLIHPLGLMGAVVAAAICAMVLEVTILIVTSRLFKLRPSNLARAVWRSFLAAALMALVVFSEGIGWAPARGETERIVFDLVIAVTSGAVTYCGSLFAMWWLCGRPDGAETLLFTIAGDTWHNVVGRPFRKRA